MLKMTYENHLGEKIVFGEGNILVNQSDIRDYNWEYEVVSGKITNFKQGENTGTPNVFVYGKDRKEIANRIYEVTEKDILANQSGTLTVGEYSKKGFFVSSKKNEYSNSVVIALAMQFVSAARWKKEVKNYFRPYPDEEYGLDFEYDYDFDFTIDYDFHTITNDSFSDSNFIMQISGPCENPTIFIDDDIYSVHIDVEENDYLVINSETKEIYVVKPDGTKINVFYARDREHYIFKKISAGKHSLDYDEGMVFFITVLDERSEPKWI